MHAALVMHRFLMNISHIAHGPRTSVPSVMNRLFAKYFRDACTSIPMHGAYGPDDIPQHFVRYAAPAMHNALYEFFRFAYDHGALPIDHRSSNTTGIFKGHGADASVPSSYRPIAVTSVVGRMC